MPHRSVSARRVGGGAIGRDGLFPHAKAGEDVRRHMQGVRNPRCDGTVAPGGGQPALSQCWVVVAVNQIVNDAGMVAVFLPQLFQESSGLKLLGQSRVSRACITRGQYREGVKGLRFEIVGILLGKLAHRFFISDYSIACSYWPMTRLSNRARVGAVRGIVVDIERPNESSLALRDSGHSHGLLDCCLAGTHFLGSRRCPARMPT